MAACKTSLLQAVIVIPVSVSIHLHTVLLSHFPRVKGCVGLTGCPVQEAQRCLICPGPANWKTKQRMCSLYSNLKLLSCHSQIVQWQRHWCHCSVHFYTHSYCPWWGRSRCCDFWWSWGSWWTPPPLCCGWTPALPWLTGSSGGNLAKSSPADHCRRSNSSGRRGPRTADTSHHEGPESAVVFLTM